ncbi:hypothetical protein GQ55_2G095300 [Panicum hallii var. hallii]|uniref:F-box domain-containing protein n=1 Tax=Panicum hallii var. hallii TaxID=1504633 RepID=A0A2T7EN84_9POAL|nr:hypothetical protein GQ55_2G095300 [Panicum hallii var. hallii]
MAAWTGPKSARTRPTATRVRGIAIVMAEKDTGSKQRRRDQGVPPGGGAGDGGPDDDLISRLPDEVLGCVITLLPTKNGARNQILSRRWRPLWRFAPLNLEAGFVGSCGDVRDDERLAARLRRLLSAHEAPRPPLLPHVPRGARPASRRRTIAPVSPSPRRPGVRARALSRP